MINIDEKLASIPTSLSRRHGRRMVVFIAGCMRGEENGQK